MNNNLLETVRWDLCVCYSDFAARIQEKFTEKFQNEELERKVVLFFFNKFNIFSINFCLEMFFNV